MCPLFCVKLILVENPASETTSTAEVIPIGITTLSIQMDVQDNHSGEYTEAITISKALKVVNLSDDGSISLPEGVHD
jgi:hypothetical protein